ncbi:MAG: 16S rRNA (guanine(966)-N(2))-methyltransferase RsmD [Candidatus Omnitrophica bacterium]|nr:16S rRNA (guanine(966)-N(2))-methyltransferase RsmD [Candidatus Omnitrophota bacterium]MBU4303692.1 16S rRNA (guanine(966)-N(2))-methyltransferase RsmD [Candidatus Omnitrophota bacterium]MBU4418789.1 16S rRNA (guanine(966)-N(2))-methyltransferase RsmD [Candidatus Omnitrophota bacterium]MBU4468450.1 16S rRNA (guanine(966)-N(2))-methyltransferase RsmD [Candidatus Omnitrophota bacterium]MCG2708442.1 16S rRNA (guanine(966)-N(2))-methyltransferase RsmD [Candidatus Omnitrophota bacterium]
MRITTGKYRNRKLHIPKGIRPTQDKVRKAVFDILGDINGLTFLELFAGSGAVGFEALSRGAAELTLVEFNHDSVLAIKRNIALFQAPACKLYHLEAEKAIKLLSLDKKSFEIIFIDPPYHKDMAKKILQTLEAYDILSPNGLIVVQHSKLEPLPQDSLKFSLIKEAKYGDTWLSIFNHA